MELHLFNDKSANENKRLCRKCKGKCCENSPCILDACDLDTSSVNAIVDEVKSKRLSIVPVVDANFYYSNQFFTFPYVYVRCASVYSKSVDLLGLNLPCSHHTKKGCDFSSKERPAGGRLLIPEKDNKCHYEHDLVTYNLVLSFMPFQDDLREACEVFTGSSIVDDCSTLYNNYNKHEFETDDELINAVVYGFKRSYQYVNLVNKYAIYKYSPDALKAINDLLKRHPGKEKEILDYIVANFNSKHVENFNMESIIERNVLRG